MSLLSPLPLLYWKANEQAFFEKWRVNGGSVFIVFPSLKDANDLIFCYSRSYVLDEIYLKVNFVTTVP